MTIKLRVELMDLNIAYITPEFIPVRGGTSTYLINLIRALKQYHVNVHILTPKRNRARACKSYIKDYEYIWNQHLFIHEIGVSQDDFYSHLRFQIEVVKLLPKLISEYKLDIIHSNFPQMPDLIFQILKGSNIPVISTVHTSVKILKETTTSALLIGGKIDEGGKSFMRYYLPLRIAEKIYLSRVKHIIAVSKFVQNHILKFVPRRNVHLIYHGVDPDLFKPHSFEHNLPTILFVGRFAAHKGVHVLMKAIPKVVQAYHDVKFIFVGGRAEDWILEELAKLHVSKTNYEFVGYVENYTELPSLYSKGLLFVSPSYEDSLGIRILEAMSCGLPLIATRVGGVPEVIEDGRTGILVEPGNVDALADSLICLLDDDDVRKNIGMNARRKVAEEFTARNMAKKTMQLYQNILES